MIKKVISGGQTGADQAALDIAIKLDIPHGGWIPKGRLTEDGPLPEKYRFARKIHPATQVFQALRIAVNNELDRLTAFMERVPDMLVKGGRICIISFHSLEDRIVKQALKDFESGCTCPRDLPRCACGFAPKMKRVMKKPLVPTREEIEANPMARSSKLRVAEKV